MKLPLSICVLAGAVLLQAAGPAQARDLTTVWDIKQKCFRAASGGECGSSFNVTTRTYISVAGQKSAAATPADAKPRPTEAAPRLPSQALQELSEKPADDEAAPKPEVAEKQPSPAQSAAAAAPAAKQAATQDEWDVASPAKKTDAKKEEAAKAAPKKDETAKTDAKTAAKSAEPAERPRGIRKTKANG